MSYKVLIALLPLLALTAAQSQQCQEMDPIPGDYLLCWDIVNGTTLHMNIKAKALGWVTMLIPDAARNLADIIVGGYMDTDGTGYLVDYHANLTSTVRNMFLISVYSLN